VAAYSLVVAAGDFNADGTVDAADYVVWQSTVGSSMDLRADGNGDGAIDDADYQVWRAHFGTTYNGVGLELSTVPEPTTRLLLLVCALAMIHSTRQRVASP
jgi:hypothetical protein